MLERRGIGLPGAAMPPVVAPMGATGARWCAPTALRYPETCWTARRRIVSFSQDWEKETGEVEGRPPLSQTLPTICSPISVANPAMAAASAPR
ncbi:MAG TPA: hypothetical protein VH916_12570, partial [Dehalococcoidia bacterium]